jgi:hypothetical protein
MQKHIKKFSALILLVISTFVFVFAKDLQTELFTATPSLEVDETVSVDLNITPELGFPVYTVTASIKYDPEFLELVESRVYENWFEVGRSPQKLIDTKNGIITLTGGYPEGTDLKKPFTKYTFKSLQTGTTKISITNGVAYDSQNVKIPLKKAELSVNIGTVISEEATPTTPIENLSVVQQDFNASQIMVNPPWWQEFFSLINAIYLIIIIVLMIIVLKLARELHRKIRGRARSKRGKRIR